MEREKDAKEKHEKSKQKISLKLFDVSVELHEEDHIVVKIQEGKPSLRFLTATLTIMDKHTHREREREGREKVRRFVTIINFQKKFERNQVIKLI